MEVIKRDKRKQKFSISKLKLSLEKSCKDAKLSPTQIKGLSDNILESLLNGLKGKRALKTTELRKRILERLDRKSRKTAQAWRKYDLKRRSKK